MIFAGEMAPDFELPVTDPTAQIPQISSGKDGAQADLRLSSLRGCWVVLYFYPRDSTPSCTLEGQQFTALVPEFAEAGARILGLSTDSPRRHESFCRKSAIGVALLSDENAVVSERFGTWQEKTMAGRKYLGIVRSTILIGPEGRVREVWSPVRTPGHAGEVLAALQRHQSAES